MKESRKPALVLYAIAAICGFSALYLAITRKPSATDIGAELLNYLRVKDAKAIAAMVPQEELTTIGLSRLQAEQIISQQVLPRSPVLTSNVTALTLKGWYVAFEKPKGDPRYFTPPMIYIPKVRPGERGLSLTMLLESVWALDRVDASLGLFDGDWQETQRNEIAQCRSLGMVNAMDWALHEAVPIPSP